MTGSNVTTRSGAASISIEDFTELKNLMQGVKTDLGGKIDRLETSLGDRITAISIDVQEQIRALKDEINGTIDALELRVTALEQEAPATQSDDRRCNFVISGLAESENEDVTDKVNNLLCNDLKLPGMSVTKAERKDKFNGNTCGVVVAVCGNLDDKKRVMDAKCSLRDSVHNKHVSIFHDKPKWQRQHESNVRLVVKTLGTHKLFLKGNRVCVQNNNNQHPQQNNVRGCGANAGNRGA